MKQITFMAALFATFTITSCNSNDIAEQTDNSNSRMQPMTFTATQENEEVTSRTAISGTAINWQTGDAVAVYDGSKTNSFTAISGGATSTTLSGSVTSGSTNFVAVYPYSENYDFTYYSSDGDFSGIAIPNIQTATSGSYDPNAAIMTATTTNQDNSFKFKNVCAFLKITTEEECQKIVVSVTSGSLAKDGYVLISSDPAFEDDYSTLYTSVVLQPKDGETSFAAGTYYIAVAPGTISGLTIDCYTSATEYYEKSSKAGAESTLQRSKSYNLGTFTTSSWTKHTSDANVFSVSDTKKVQFTDKGNLYWDGQAFHLESSQIAYPDKWDENYVGHFFWVNHTDYASGTDAYMPYAQTLNSKTERTDYTFWCGVGNPLTVDNIEGLYVLTADEWDYLLGDNALRKGRYATKVAVTIGQNTGYNCLVIAPDVCINGYVFDNTKTSYTAEEWEVAQAAGVVCLPVSGYRANDSFTSTTEGHYCTASPGDGEGGGAKELLFDSNGFNSTGPINSCQREAGCAIRLVKTYGE